MRLLIKGVGLSEISVLTLVHKQKHELKSTFGGI